MIDCSKCDMLAGCKGVWKEECKGPKEFVNPYLRKKKGGKRKSVLVSGYYRLIHLKESKQV